LYEGRNGARHSVIAGEARNIGVNFFHEFFNIILGFGSGRHSYLHFGRKRTAILIRQVKTGI
jgi:hypothetical protein